MLYILFVIALCLCVGANGQTIRPGSKTILTLRQSDKDTRVIGISALFSPDFTVNNEDLIRTNSDACTVSDLRESVLHRWVVVSRGRCDFIQKVRTCVAFVGVYDIASSY